MYVQIQGSKMQEHVCYISLLSFEQDDGFGNVLYAPPETDKFVCEFVNENLH